jgi:hypothetical protein
VRLTVAGDALVAIATVPVLDGLVSRRAPWLAAALGAAAAPRGVREGRSGGDVPDAVRDLLKTARALATRWGWQQLEGDGPALRFAVPGEHDLPPLTLAAEADGLHVVRPLPLLPARDAAPAVRAAVAHAALVLNGTVDAARVAVRDPRALTIAVESRLPAADPDEDEAACMLEGVRRAAAHAASVLDCLSVPAVARVYATAHSLPGPEADREPHEKE